MAKTLYIIGACIVIVLGAIAGTLHTRLRVDQAVPYSAYHVFVPGWRTVSSPGEEVDLQAWRGTRRTNDPLPMSKREADLQTANAYVEVMRRAAPDRHFIIDESGGHVRLFQPRREWREFSWRMPVRVGPWSQADGRV